VKPHQGGHISSVTIRISNITVRIGNRQTHTMQHGAQVRLERKQDLGWER
jgi:hypothetical protein